MGARMMLGVMVTDQPLPLRGTRPQARQEVRCISGGDRDRLAILDAIAEPVLHVA
jgi:hypothetical protein